MKSTGRRSIRYYVHTDGQLFRLRSKDHLALIRGEVKLPRFANCEMRIIEVAVLKAHNVVTRSLRGLIQHFDADGTLKVSDAVDAVDLTLRSNRMPGLAPNVVSLVPELERRAWDAGHMWVVDQNSVELIENDILKRTKLPAFPMEK